MNIWRRLLLPVFILITISGIVFHAPPVHALSKDELIKEYRKQAGLKWLCDNANTMRSPKGSAADSLSNYFPIVHASGGGGRVGTVGTTGNSVYTVQSHFSSFANNSNWDDANVVREFMLGLGYRWQGDTFTHPGAAAVCSNATSKYNGGKSPDVTSAPMKWAKASSELEFKCEINRLGKPADIRATMGDKVELARTNGEDGDGWTYVLVNEITDSGTIEEVIYGVDRKDSWGGDRECVDLAKQASANAKPAVEGTKKATTEARSNAAGRYTAEELCRPLQTANPDEYSGCVGDITKKTSQCFAKYGDDIAKIKQCLIKSLPQSYHGEITDDLIKRALEHAKNSTQDQTITGGAAENEEDQPTCAITGIGWIICPTMNFIATLNDAMFDLVSLLLAARPDMFIMEDSNQTYAAWGVFRNIANVAFVIVFLVVIFSQVTSQGISNYGIKRILPRLIIGAILINTSFLISALAADVSSILGSSIKGFLEQAAAGSQPVDNWNWGHMVGFILGGGGLTATAGVAGLAALWAIGIPGAIAFLVAMLMTLLILIGRQAGIILLATLSPLAFAALILPNTEKWFKRWMSMFGGLLMVFPVVSLLFGAGSFAATILNNNNDYVMQIAALIVSALPLVATPMLLRKSMDSLGTIGQMAGSLSGRFSGKAKEAASNSSFVKHREKLAAQRKAQIQSGTYKESFARFDPRRLRNLRSHVNARINQNERFNKITGNYGERMSVLGASVAAAQDKEAMEAANASVSSMNLDGAGLMNLIEHGKDKNGNQVTDHQRRAAMQQLAPIMTGGEARKLASLSVNFNDDMRKEAAAAVRTAAPKAPWLGGRTLAEIQAGTFDESTAMNRYMQEKMSAEDFNTMDAASIDALNAQARAQFNLGNTDPQSKLESAKATHNRSVELTGKISTGNRDALRRI